MIFGPKSLVGRALLHIMTNLSADEAIVAEYTVLESGLVDGVLKIRVRGRIETPSATSRPVGLRVQDPNFSPLRISVDQASGFLANGTLVLATLRRFDEQPWQAIDFELDFKFNFDSIWKVRKDSWCLSVPWALPIALSKPGKEAKRQTRITIQQGTGALLRPIGGIAARLGPGQWSPTVTQIQSTVMILGPDAWAPNPELVHDVAVPPETYRVLGVRRVDEFSDQVQRALRFFENRLRLVFPGRLVLGIPAGFGGAGRFPAPGVIAAVLRSKNTVSPQAIAPFVFQQFMEGVISFQERRHKGLGLAVVFCASLHYFKSEEPQWLTAMCERLGSGQSLSEWGESVVRLRAARESRRIQSARLGLQLFRTGMPANDFFETMTEFLRTNWGTVQPERVLRELLRSRGAQLPT